jgi:hypothetical protein
VLHTQKFYIADCQRSPFIEIFEPERSKNQQIRQAPRFFLKNIDI